MNRVIKSIAHSQPSKTVLRGWLSSKPLCRVPRFETGNRLKCPQSNLPDRSAKGMGEISSAADKWPSKGSWVAIYAFCGALVGIADIVLASQINSAHPGIGLGYELHAIAAVVIGGASLMGGRGEVSGAILGAAILDLPDGVQVDQFALPLGKLRSQDQCPVVELLLNDPWAKPIGGSLQRCDVVDSQKRIGALLAHSAQPGQDLILFADTFLGPLDGDVVVNGKSFHPVLIVIGTLAEHFLAQDWNSEDLAKEMNHLLGPRQSAQVTVDDDSAEAVVYKEQQPAEKLRE
jgi:hypothetical protein